MRVTGLTPIPETPDFKNPVILPDQGFMVIAESHISVHLYEGGVAHLDVFSCKDFHERRRDVLKLAERIFGGSWLARYFYRSVPPAPDGGG